MKNPEVRVLLIDDDRDYYILIGHLLSKIKDSHYNLQWVSTFDASLDAIKYGEHDVVLLDYHLGSHSGVDILRKAVALGCTAPIIMLTAEEDRKIDMETMKLGAADYLIKMQVNAVLLERSIRYAIERKRAEQNVLNSEKKYRTLFDRIADPIFIFDKDNNHFVDCNESALRIYGYSRDELKTMTPYDLHPPEDLAKVQQNIGMRNTDKPNTYEHLTKAGKRIIVEILSDEIEYQSRPAWISIARDVTERTKADQLLRKTYAETELLLSSISSILIGVSPGDRITHWNAAAEETFGISSAKAIGLPFLNVNIRWNWPGIFEKISDCRDREEPTHLEEVRYTKPDSKDGFLAMTINPILNDKYIHKGYLLIADEITENKILEAQLSQAQKLESIGQLAAGIAHELNTPIQYIGDNARFLQDSFDELGQVLRKNTEFLAATKESEPSQTLIDEVKKVIEDADLDYLAGEIPSAIQQSLEGVDRVASIVRAMKEFSHPGTEEKTLSDINKALENTITVAKNEWKYLAEVHTDFAEALPPVLCLLGELNQVFLNIIVNATHAIGNKEGSTDEKGIIKIMTRHDDHEIEIAISDTGSGIPKEIQDRIFDPFFTTKEVGKGTGQGLAISHNVVVNKHGGKLTFETEAGHGTTFRIHLPINS